MLPSLTYPPNSAGLDFGVQRARGHKGSAAGRILVQTRKRGLAAHRDLATKLGAPGSSPPCTPDGCRPPPSPPPSPPGGHCRHHPAVAAVAAATSPGPLPPQRIMLAPSPRLPPSPLLPAGVMSRFGR